MSDSPVELVPRRLAEVSRLITGSYAPGLDPELVMRRRVNKIGNEYGELLDAIEGFTGENPRKGIYKTRDDVIDELLDCASSSLAAVEHMTGDRGESLNRLAARVEMQAARLRAALPPSIPVAKAGALGPLCTICGLPKSPAHSKTRSGGYLTGHLFSPPPTADEVRAARDLTDLVMHEVKVGDEPLHPSRVMRPSTPVDNPVDPEEDTDAQAADTTQAPGSPGARGQQQGPEQEVQRGPGGQAPDAEPAPGAPEPETVEGAPGWLVVTYSHQCPPECPDLGMVVTEKHWLGRLIHVIPPTCPATGVALVEVSRGHQASRLAGANHIDSRFRRVQ